MITPLSGNLPSTAGIKAFSTAPTGSRSDRSPVTKRFRGTRHLARE